MGNPSFISIIYNLGSSIGTVRRILVFTENRLLAMQFPKNLIFKFVGFILMLSFFHKVHAKIRERFFHFFYFGITTK